MAEPMNITIDAKDVLHDKRHGVPKCVTKHPNDKFYYVDIREGVVLEYNPAKGTKAPIKEYDCPNPNYTGRDSKEPEYECATAIGLNQDGSLIVARQSGVYFLNPDAKPGEEWLKICDIPDLGDDMRPNNGAMIQCHDNKTRFFLGTTTKDNKPRADGSKPGKLFVLDQVQGGGFQLHELADNLVTVNAVSGGVRDDGQATQITFADSNADVATLKMANYLPGVKKLTGAQDFMDFKQNGGIAKNGRPDGTSQVMFNNRPCIAVAAIDTNKIRVFDLESKDEVATLTLPDDVKKPTMATFSTGKDGKTVCYVSTLAPPDSPPENAGKIYSKILPENFKPVEYVGTYPGFEAMKSVSVHVNATEGESRRVAK